VKAVVKAVVESRKLTAAYPAVQNPKDVPLNEQATSRVLDDGVVSRAISEFVLGREKLTS
jgi:hypothetical protein